MSCLQRRRRPLEGRTQPCGKTISRLLNDQDQETITLISQISALMASRSVPRQQSCFQHPHQGPRGGWHGSQCSHPSLAS